VKRKHTDQVLNLLQQQIGNAEEVKEIKDAAEKVSQHWINPVDGGKAETNGLIYGLVQSGKTGVLTVTGAMGADEGYRTIIILTSDIDPLYEQTLRRARQAFPGIEIIGKQDFRDATEFIQRIKGDKCVIVTTKNKSLLSTLIQNFKQGRVRGLSCLIIDDEADQASLNTRARKGGDPSAINALIAQLRKFFEKNTYLQVTATPQALFLQTPGHDFRPKFTVLSHPGAEYVGGEDFFGGGADLVREFDINDIAILTPGPQPTPSLQIPTSLLRALDTFLIAATYKRVGQPDQNCAFLCHVSTKTTDHKHIVALLRSYKTQLSKGLKKGNAALRQRLKAAYDDLCSTDKGLSKQSFDSLLDDISFLTPGIVVKLVNGETDEDVAVESPLNLFVGGNKLGRGVTIKNLLVTYYGRNPRSPQADTVLQHARMYGYRRADIGLLRLFLPAQLHTVFIAINRMEQGLRDLIARKPSEEFRGVFVESGVKATRGNVLAPGSIGVYSAGSTYNPAQVMRNSSIASFTKQIDDLLAHMGDKSLAEVPISQIRQLIALTKPDESQSEFVWNSTAIDGALLQLLNITGESEGYLYVDRNRKLRENRHETQGFLSGGEVNSIPNDKVALILFRTAEERGKKAAWWPSIRFSTGNYGFAFAV